MKLWRKPARWLLPLSLAGLGLVIALIITYGELPNPIFYLRLDLATLLFFLSLVLTLVVYGVFLTIELLDRQARRLTARATSDRLRFFRRLDHELKNPLTAIRAGVANATGAPDEASRQAAYSTIEAQALRLGGLAADLRKLAELESRPLERVAVDVAALLSEAFELAEEQAAGRQLVLSIPQAPWPLPEIPGDPDLLFLAIYNLIENAIKFTQPSGRVEVRAFEDGNGLTIEVADTGTGIPEAELPYVWEDLYRGQGARGVPGSGLGLALVRAIIERHAGQVSLRSRLGQGSVCTLRLPLG